MLRITRRDVPSQKEHLEARLLDAERPRSERKKAAAALAQLGTSPVALIRARSEVFDTYARDVVEAKAIRAELDARKMGVSLPKSPLESTPDGRAQAHARVTNLLSHAAQFREAMGLDTRALRAKVADVAREARLRELSESSLAIVAREAYEHGVRLEISDGGKGNILRTLRLAHDAADEILARRGEQPLPAREIRFDDVGKLLEATKPHVERAEAMTPRPAPVHGEAKAREVLHRYRDEEAGADARWYATLAVGGGLLTGGAISVFAAPLAIAAQRKARARGHLAVREVEALLRATCREAKAIIIDLARLEIVDAARARRPHFPRVCRAPRDGELSQLAAGHPTLSTVEARADLTALLKLLAEEQAPSLTRAP